MLLEELRQMAQKKLAERRANPEENPANLAFSKDVVKLLSNADYITNAPRSLLNLSLFSIGVPFKEIDDTRERLLAELNKTYPAVEPSFFRRDEE